MLLDAWITTLHIAFFAIGLSMSEGMSLYMQSLLRAGVPDTKLLAARAKYFDRIGAVAWLLCAGTGLFLCRDYPKCRRNPELSDSTLCET